MSPPRGDARATEASGWWRRWPALAGGAVALAALLAAGLQLAGLHSKVEAIDSVAVLPFVNSSGDPDSEYLSDGITESLIDNLSQLPSLRVTARSTVFRYKGREIDPQKIGHDLRVRAVLSGRLLQRDGTLIVRTELMDVANGSQLWGGQYNRKVADVFALQDELSKEISDRFRLRLTNEEKQRLTNVTPTMRKRTSCISKASITGTNGARTPFQNRSNTLIAQSVQTRPMRWLTRGWPTPTI